MVNQTKTIMVVDDEPDLLTITKKMLEHDGYEVHAFRRPEEALEHVELNGCQACSILVADIRMPVINGIELARRVKKLRPEIKIMLMTAFEVHKDEWQKTLPSTQVDEFLVKPLRMSDLVEAIKRCADGNGRA